MEENILLDLLVEMFDDQLEQIFQRDLRTNASMEKRKKIDVGRFDEESSDDFFLFVDLRRSIELVQLVFRCVVEKLVDQLQLFSVFGDFVSPAEKLFVRLESRRSSEFVEEVASLPEIRMFDQIVGDRSELVEGRQMFEQRKNVSPVKMRFDEEDENVVRS